jgi:hypothetical protein
MKWFDRLTPLCWKCWQRIDWKPVRISLGGLIKRFGRDTIKPSQIVIENYSLSSSEQDGALQIDSSGKVIEVFGSEVPFEKHRSSRHPGVGPCLVKAGVARRLVALLRLAIPADGR